MTSIAFSPDGGRIAAGSKDKMIRVWNVQRGPEPAAVDVALGGFGNWVNAVAFSEDGRMLVGGGSDNTIRFWDVDGWRPHEPALPSPSPVTGVAFLPGVEGLDSVGTMCCDEDPCRILNATVINRGREARLRPGASLGNRS